MTNLKTVFDADYFDDVAITLKRLHKFTGEVLGRLLADSLGGKLTAVGAEITDHATALFGAMQTVDIGIGTRRGNARLMWEALRGLNAQLDADDELIWLKAKKDPRIGTAFFPTGSRAEYTRASLLTADVLFARVRKAAHEYAAVLGADFNPALYDTLATQFDAARGDTRTADAATGTGRADSADEHRPALTQALTRAVKTVAQLLPHDPARAAKYFPTELLLPGKSADNSDSDSDTDPADPTGPTPPPAG